MKYKRREQNKTKNTFSLYDVDPGTAIRALNISMLFRKFHGSETNETDEWFRSLSLSVLPLTVTVEIERARQTQKRWRLFSTSSSSSFFSYAPKPNDMPNEIRFKHATVGNVRISSFHLVFISCARSHHFPSTFLPISRSHRRWSKIMFVSVVKRETMIHIITTDYICGAHFRLHKKKANESYTHAKTTTKMNFLIGKAKFYRK